MSRLCFVFAAWVLALAFSAVPARAEGRVYLLRGLANVFSTGMDSLAQKLQQRGIAVSAHNHLEYDSLVAEAVSLQKSGKGPIVIAGHSYGADAAVAMASRMNAQGAPVALVVLFGPTYDLAIPSNVARVVNYYQSGNMLWRGTATKGAGFRGTIANVNLDNDPAITHFNIEKSDRLHNEIIGRVQALTARARGATRLTRAATDP